MSDPRYTIARRTPATPDTVLGAIRDAVTAGRRGALPVARLKGTRGVGGKVRGERFTVWPDRIWEGDRTELAGMVLPTDDGGSDVRASVLEDRNAPTRTLVLLVSTVILALTGNAELAWVGACFTALAAITSFRSADGIRNHGEAAFLVEWLNAVLDRLDAPPVAPAEGEADPVPSASAS